MAPKKNPVYDREGYRILDDDDLAKLVAAVRADSQVGRGTGSMAVEVPDEELAEWFSEERYIVTKWDAIHFARAYLGCPSCNVYNDLVTQDLEWASEGHCIDSDCF